MRSSPIVALYQCNDEPTCQRDEHRSILHALSDSDTALAVKLTEQHLVRIPANVTGHSGDRDRFAHGHHAGVSFVL